MPDGPSKGASILRTGAQKAGCTLSLLDVPDPLSIGKNTFRVKRAPPRAVDVRVEFRASVGTVAITAPAVTVTTDATTGEATVTVSITAATAGARLVIDARAGGQMTADSGAVR